MTAPIDRPWLHSYAPGVPADIEPVTGTLVDLIDDAVSTYRRKPALEFFGRETSYRDLGDQVARAAEGLRRLGVKHGDRVALVLPNCPQHVVAFYAVLRLGAVVVEHNPLYTDRELRHQFEDHGAKVAIAWDKLVDRLAELPARHPLRHVVCVDMTEAHAASASGSRCGCRSRRRRRRGAPLTAHAAGRAARVAVEARSSRPTASAQADPRPALDDTALLQYTSGTTGSPKGAILTHRNLRSNAEQGRAWVPGLVDGERDLLRRAAVLPRLRPDALPDLRDEHRGDARAVPEVRRRPGARRRAKKPRRRSCRPCRPIYERLAAAAASAASTCRPSRFAISGR